MLKIEELRDMTESEIKQFFKEVIMDQTEEFDWEDFSIKYNKIYANYDEEEEVGIDENSIATDVAKYLKGISSYRYFDQSCENYIDKIYIEEGNLVIEDGSAGDYILRDVNKIKELIDFLIFSVINLIDKLEDRNQALNSLFD